MNIQFELLPEETQAECKEILKAYDDVNVTYEDGKFRVGTGLNLRAEYPSDYQFVGEYKAVDIFTEDERIINFIECFRWYPSFYKGEKDWEMITKIKEMGFDKTPKIAFDKDKNIILEAE